MQQGFSFCFSDMNSMELASLVMTPIHRFKVHKKKSEKKPKKHHDKDVKVKKNPKVENEGKANLVDNLIKNDKEDKSGTHEDTKEKQKMEKDKEDDEEMEEEKAKKENKKEKENDKESKQKEKEKKMKDEDEDEMDDKDTTSKDSWAEEEIPAKDGEQYTSSKRSEIPHAFDEIANRLDF